MAHAVLPTFSSLSKRLQGGNRRCNRYSFTSARDSNHELGSQTRKSAVVQTISSVLVTPQLSNHQNTYFNERTDYQMYVRNSGLEGHIDKSRLDMIDRCGPSPFGWQKGI